MRYYFLIGLCLCLSACIKKKLVKPEAAPPPVDGIYVEKFYDDKDPEQWGIFTNGKNPALKESDELKNTLDRMKNDPVYSNEIMEKMNAL